MKTILVVGVVLVACGRTGEAEIGEQKREESTTTTVHMEAMEVGQASTTTEQEMPSETTATTERKVAVTGTTTMPEIEVGNDLGTILACIRSYEGDYSTNTGNGYYGAYQFDISTWESVGGEGNPAEASPAEQDARAAELYRRRGLQPWPTPAIMC